MDPLKSIEKPLQQNFGVDGRPGGRPFLGGHKGSAAITSLLALIVIGALGFYWYSRKEQRRHLFERESSALVRSILERIGNYEDGLWAGVAFIHARGNKLGSDDWKKFATAQDLLAKYPGINGVSVVFSVRKREIGKFVAEQRVTRPDFNIHPEHLINEYLPIVFIVPLAGNEKAVGMDLAFEEKRLASAVQARSTGRAQITAPIALVQDMGKTPGFLFYAPYYDAGGEDVKLWTNEKRQENFLGMISMPIVMNKFIRGIRTEGRAVYVSLKIYDGDDLLYDEQNANNINFDPTPLFSQKVEVMVTGRKWTIDLRSTKAVRGEK